MLLLSRSRGDEVRNGEGPLLAMEREARSLALEEAYVHEVYHQMGCQESKAPWPRVVQFLNHLEPGSIVCDVGCGSGKYLSVNPSVFKLGVDRCNRLAETARLEQNEVLVCDNLTLPFRDESFDAVLSIAVVHHFATTERRVGALRELARVLRIGGRLVISVWAMEQRHRKFESQDVLVPWHRPQALSTPSLELTPTTTSEDDSHLHHHPYTACTQTSDSDSNRSVKNNKERKKGKEKQKEVTTSPSCSSLSSPNETCYSFVRRALQKLAGNKKNGSRNRPWFLDSWTNCSNKEPPPRRYDPEGCEDIHDLPIELRRLEDDHEIPSRRQTFTCSGSTNEQQLNHKSRSLTDIFNHEQKLIVRSQSSIPSLDNSELDITAHKGKTEIVSISKPRLVKQKKSVCDEDMDSEERDQATDMKDLVKALPEFKITGFGLNRKGNVFKQSSMNEELMSTERLREKERLKQNIQKQASLNEELIFNRNNKTLDSLKDSIFSTSTAKRFQILKNGLTNKIKNSTTGIEKVAGSSIKNGFVRILQGWTSSDVNIQIPQQLSNPSSNSIPEMKNLIDGRKEQANERRHSKEDGSDSSKDSSLQSDTSVDSEDSFASVIFIPKAEQVDQQSTNTSPTLQSNPASPQPTSPKIKFPPPVSPKLKNSQHSFGMSSHPASPKLKHPNQLLGSSTPSSPKIKYFPQPTSPRPYQNSFSTSPTCTTFKPNTSPNGNNVSPTFKSNDFFSKQIPSIPPFKSPTNTVSPLTETIKETKSDLIEKPTISKTEEMTEVAENVKNGETIQTEKVKSPASSKDTTLSPLNFFSTIPKVDLEAYQNVEKQLLQQVKEDHPPKPGPRTQFPLVRRAMTISGRSDSPPSRAVPRLLSLEIFNPETDDMDSDSSGVSSPDSIGSVISIKNEEEGPASEQKKEGMNDEVSRSSGVGAEIASIKLKTEFYNENSELELKSDEPNPSSKFSPLLEAAAGVANCLEETVDTVIQSSPRSRRKQLQLLCDPWMALQDDIDTHNSPKNCLHLNESDTKTKISPQISTTIVSSPKRNKSKLEKADTDIIQDYNNSWDEECRQHLAEFAEKLSEKLLAEIDRYREQKSKSLQLSPDIQGGVQCSDFNSELYLSRLNEDLEDINKMTIDLQKDDDTYISRLMESSGKEILNQKELERIKGEGATSNENHVESKKDIMTTLEPRKESDVADNDKRIPHVRLESNKSNDVIEERIPLLQEENDYFYSSTIDFEFNEPKSLCNNKTVRENRYSIESENSQNKDFQVKVSKEPILVERFSTSNDETTAEECSTEGVWIESRRNTILKNDSLPDNTVCENNNEKDGEDDSLKLDLILNKESLRKPSISIELSDFPETNSEKKESSEFSLLSIGLSIESNEGADMSEKTASSSDGSRSGSRRETMQISDSGSVLSLRPGLSVESSDAGEISDKGGSDGSRDSRRDTISLSDVTSCSQNSLLRPGNSVESSDPGDVSEKTGSDLSHQNTSSAGKTPSTASFTSDRASDCSKDARFADRRMARCDGRSSSEETPLPKSCTNKLVRQGASAQEPSETMSKTQSSETSLSGSTSQDSLISDTGGGAITFHRYYHVFKEGELDQLIEKYVENLHIISSYYDHANWCIIAEKVQVWTI